MSTPAAPFAPFRAAPFRAPALPARCTALCCISLPVALVIPTPCRPLPTRLLIPAETPVASPARGPASCRSFAYAALRSSLLTSLLTTLAAAHSLHSARPHYRNPPHRPARRVRSLQTGYVLLRLRLRATSPASGHYRPVPASFPASNYWSCSASTDTPSNASPYTAAVPHGAEKAPRRPSAHQIKPLAAGPKSPPPAGKVCVQATQARNKARFAASLFGEHPNPPPPCPG
ncbi:hypothetical protein GCM10023185_19470 [Hymenobacter saemangeumensis]|uniref:Uncharacterized protein n=1 Tax=Hymenobacter saemangeumensis TaxID=1084522 RepID=A0ABP8ICF9_9BACT